MDEKDIPAREPEETGTQPVQKAVPLDTTAELPLVKASGELEGHPLPDTLRGLAPAFRSHPAWMLIVQWTTQVTRDSENYLKDLNLARQQLEAEKIRSATLQERLSGLKRTASLKTFIQAIGTLLAGLALPVYEKTNELYGALVGVLGVIMILVGWALGKSRD